MFMWNLLFNDVMVETPDLKHGKCEPEPIISTKCKILSEYFLAATRPW